MKTAHPHHALSELKALPVQFGYAGVGLVLLLAGRRLFWLFIGAMGFIAATRAAETWFPEGDHQVLLAVGIIAGVFGALLAIFLQKFAIGLAGAVAGAYYGIALLDLNGMSGESWAWIAIVAAAVIGAIFMHFVFRWALIIFSSIAGAHLITESFPLAPQMSTALFIGLAVVGIVFQGRQLRPKAEV